MLQQKKLAYEDVNLLSEMVFGTVAMTYRGPSFKVKHDFVLIQNSKLRFLIKSKKKLFN